MNSLFFKAKNQKLANAIKIDSPQHFRDSIERVYELPGVSFKDKVSALNLAKSRAAAQLKRVNLSRVEKAQFGEINRIKINLKR